MLLAVGEPRYPVAKISLQPRLLLLIMIVYGLKASTAAVLVVAPSRPPRACRKTSIGARRWPGSGRRRSGIFGARTRASRPLLPCKLSMVASKTARHDQHDQVSVRIKCHSTRYMPDMMYAPATTIQYTCSQDSTTWNNLSNVLHALATNYLGLVWVTI